MAERLASRPPLADRMYSLLLEQFMAGERLPGEPLNIGALTRELGVSQTPLREALARLEHTGLVTREALKGYHVAPMLGPDEVASLMDARRVIEPELSRLAATRTTPAFLDEAAASMSELQDAAGSADEDPRDFRVYWTADDRFHQLIAERCGNPFLLSAFEALHPQIQRFRLFSKIGHTGARFAVVEHGQVLDALRDGDPDRARARMSEHLRNAKERTQALLQHIDEKDGE
jgi:DNA-binding GntR family transcriptional regulator